MEGKDINQKHLQDLACMHWKKLGQEQILRIFNKGAES